MRHAECVIHVGVEALNQVSDEGGVVACLALGETEVLEYLDAGATRIGATATAVILDAVEGIETADEGKGY